MLFHFGQDIIGGAVENAVNPFDPVGRCTVPQSLDHRDATGNRRFIAQGEVARFGGLRQFHPVVGDHCLVGSDKGFAGCQTLAREFERGAVGSADHFHHAIDILLFGQRRGRIEPGIG